MAYSALPDDGSMLLHTICGITQDDCVRLGIPITLRVARFVKFIITEIFPGGRVPTLSMVQTQASNAGFRVSRVQSLQPHYAKTLGPSGQPRWRPIETTPSRSSRKRFTTAT